MYTIVYDHTAKHPRTKRIHRVIRLIFDKPEYSRFTPDSLGPAQFQSLLDLSIKCLSRGTADGVMIYGFDCLDKEQHASFNRGRLILTRDGKGWLGDGEIIAGGEKDRKGYASHQWDVNCPTTFHRAPLYPSPAFQSENGDATPTPE